MKPASAKSTSGHHRCLYLSPTGRQCRNWAQDPRAMFCHRHFEAQPHGPDDFAFALLNHACNFQNAHGIHDSTRRLYTLLAAGAISPRRAAVLGYLTSLMLRTLPAVYKDPCPEAGTPMSAAQLAEREKGKSLAAAPASRPPAAPVPPRECMLAKKAVLAPKPVHTQKPAAIPKPVPAQEPVLTPKILPQHSAQPTPHPPADPAPPTTTASTPDVLGNGPGRPMPTTRAEFAAQVLKSLASTPSTTTKPNLSTTTAAVTSPTGKDLSSPLKSPPGTSTSEATDEKISEPSSAPVNQPTYKKSYQARLHTNINWPVTGSPPPWGWTTDP